MFSSINIAKILYPIWNELIVNKKIWFIGDGSHLPGSQNQDSERDLMEGNSKQQSDQNKRYSYMNNDSQLHIGGPIISSSSSTPGNYTDTLTYKKVQIKLNTSWRT